MEISTREPVVNPSNSRDSEATIQPADLVRTQRNESRSTPAGAGPALEETLANSTLRKRLNKWTHTVSNDSWRNRILMMN